MVNGTEVSYLTQHGCLMALQKISRRMTTVIIVQTKIQNFIKFKHSKHWNKQL